MKTHFTRQSLNRNHNVLAILGTCDDRDLIRVSISISFDDPALDAVIMKNKEEEAYLLEVFPLDGLI